MKSWVYTLIDPWQPHAPHGPTCYICCGARCCRPMKIKPQGPGKKRAKAPPFRGPWYFYVFRGASNYPSNMIKPGVLHHKKLVSLETHSGIMTFFHVKQVEMIVTKLFDGWEKTTPRWMLGIFVGSPWLPQTLISSFRSPLDSKTRDAQPTAFESKVIQTLVGLIRDSSIGLLIIISITLGSTVVQSPNLSSTNSGFEH